MVQIYMSLDALENKQTQNTIMIRSKPDYELAMTT